MKKITTSIIASIAISMMIGCGDNSSSSAAVSSSSSTPTTSSATISDSKIAGLDYITNSGKSSVTDSNGRFTFDSNDSNITFKLGELTIGSFNLHNLKSDKLVLIGELFGLDRNNTTDTRLLKVIRLLQSFDDDNNPDDGIQISDTVKDKISDLIDNNASIHKNLIDNDIDTIKFIVTNQNKNFILEREARKHYEKTLTNLGIVPQTLPFETVWNITPTDKKISINTDSKYNYNYTIDWGDGTIEKNITSSKEHTYANEGNYTIKISGTFPYFRIDRYDSEQLLRVSNWGDIEWQNFYSSFYKSTNLEINATNTPDLSNVTNISQMFAYATHFNQNINNWDVSHITNMSKLFYYATNFNQPLDKWNTSNVYDMSYMFYNAQEFNQSINDWDVSHVIDMSYMFSGAKNFNQSLDKWNTYNVIDMSYMFYNAQKFNQSINDWNTANVVDMNNMFHGALNFNQPLNTWDISQVTDLSHMFHSALNFNQSLNSWDTSQVTDLSYMFYNAPRFRAHVEDWNTSNVTDMSYMFAYATRFDQVVCKFDVSHVTNMSHMFFYDRLFGINHMKFIPYDCSDWNVSNVTNMDSMFSYSNFYGDLTKWPVQPGVSHHNFAFGSRLMKRDEPQWQDE